MKKIFALISALVLVLSITACSNSSQVDNQEKEETTTHIETTEAEETVESTTLNTSEETSSDAEKDTAEIKTTEKSDNKPSDKTDNSTTAKNPVTTTQRPQATAPSPKQLPKYSPEAEIITLFNKINNYRVQNGLGKLTLDTNLCKMAYIRAQEQIGLKGHTRPDNTKYYSILDEYNYSYMGCGENIAFFPDLSPDDIFNKWKGSSEHDANMVESRWTKSGIALYKNADGHYTIVHLFAC